MCLFASVDTVICVCAGVGLSVYMWGCGCVFYEEDRYTKVHMQTYILCELQF